MRDLITKHAAKKSDLQQIGKKKLLVHVQNNVIQYRLWWYSWSTHRCHNSRLWLQGCQSYKQTANFPQWLKSTVVQKLLEILVNLSMELLEITVKTVNS